MRTYSVSHKSKAVTWNFAEDGGTKDVSYNLDLFIPQGAWIFPFTSFIFPIALSSATGDSKFNIGWGGGYYNALIANFQIGNDYNINLTPGTASANQSSWYNYCVYNNTGYEQLILTVKEEDMDSGSFIFVVNWIELS